MRRVKHMGHKKQDERGIALVLVLIALLIVTSIGLAMMFSTDTETSINSNYRDEQTAFYAAKAGLEEARDRMRSGATNSISGSLPTALPGTLGGVLYITNPAGSASTYYVDGKSANASYYVCWNGTNEFASSTACASPNNPVYLLTTMAVT